MVFFAKNWIKRRVFVERWIGDESAIKKLQTND
jgi:hypothetical protein